MVTFLCFVAWGGLVVVAIPALHREIESGKERVRKSPVGRNA